MNFEETREPGADSSGEDHRPHESGPAEVDIHQLAEKVYRLMERDLRLERARNGNLGGRRWVG